MRGLSSIHTVLRSRNWIRHTGDLPSRPSLGARTISSFFPVDTAEEEATTGIHPRAAASSAPRRDYTTLPSLAEHSLLLGKHHSRSRGRRQRESLLLLVPHQHLRNFHSEAEYHRVADGTLHALQDAIDEAFERYDDDNNNDDSGTVAAAPPEYELNVASGVLTLTLPGRGTWVLNKQTPNQQIWWSSPLSGPKRFEFLEGAWCSTKDGLTLGPLLAQELRHVHPRLDVDLTAL